MLNTYRSSLAELIGTFGLVFVIAGASCWTGRIGTSALGVSVNRILFLALAYGFSYGVMVSLTIGVSGGHLNPAITIAEFVSGSISPRKTVLYIISQVIGAVLAVGSLRVILDFDLWVKTEIGANFINRNYLSFYSSYLDFLEGIIGSTVIGAIVLEFILTFYLALIFYVARKTVSLQPLVGVFVGLIVAANTIVGASLTGASMNPARSFGPALVSNYWVEHYVFWLGPIAGAIAGVYVAKLLFLEK